METSSIHLVNHSHSTRSLKNSVQAPILSEYVDYRAYLSDFYLYKKRSHQGLRAYSYSVFSAAADIKSPNYLKLIIDGKRNLSEEMIGKFAKALKLNRFETFEFRLLVRYGQESDPLRRNQILRELADIRVNRQIKDGEIDREKWERIPNWVGLVLYAMADQKEVNFSLSQLKQLLRGKASEEDIKQSLEKLFEGGQLKRSEGRVEKGEPISGKEEVPVPLVRKLQAEMNYLGMESLFQDSPKEREFGSLTLSLTEEEFEKYRFELRQLRKRIHKEVAVDRETSPADRIYQLNLQLFPVTDSVSKK